MIETRLSAPGPSSENRPADLSLHSPIYPLTLCRVDMGNRYVYMNKPGAFLDLAAERAEIARQRRELDEYERALDVIEQRQKRAVQAAPVTIEKPSGLTEAVRIAITTFGQTEFTVR